MIGGNLTPLAHSPPLILTFSHKGRRNENLDFEFGAFSFVWDML